MRWFAEVSGNPRNRLVGFNDGRHGTEIFGRHPELPREIVAWFVDTLVRSPADPTARFTQRRTAISEFWAVATQRGGASNATRLFRDARKRDPKAFLRRTASQTVTLPVGRTTWFSPPSRSVWIF